jgi:hypothetical protein
MATYGQYVLTLSDWAKRLDPDGKTAAIAELLAQTNPILDDMLFKEGNLPTGERTTIRTGLPTAYWRLLNQPVQTSKSSTAQVDESCGMLEAWSEVDKDLAELNGNTGAFRLSEAQAFMEAMNQEMAQTVFYGNSSTAPEEFNGLDVRYNSLSATNGENIIQGDSGADAGVTSIWLIVWGANTCFGIFPKGSKAGLNHEDLGLVTVEGSTGIGGTRLRAYQDRFTWKAGLVVKDWRYVARGCNIDVSDLNAASGAVDLGAMMVRMIHRIPNLNAGRAAFYVNRTVAQALDLQARASVSGNNISYASFGVVNSNHALNGAGSYSNYEGRPVMSFRGIPVRVTDAILTTESVIS